MIRGAKTGGRPHSQVVVEGPPGSRTKGGRSVSPETRHLPDPSLPQDPPKEQGGGPDVVLPMVRTVDETTTWGTKHLFLERLITVFERGLFYTQSEEPQRTNTELESEPGVGRIE